MVKLLQENELKLNNLIDSMKKLCSVLSKFNAKLAANESFITEFIQNNVLKEKV